MSRSRLLVAAAFLLVFSGVFACGQSSPPPAPGATAADAAVPSALRERVSWFGLYLRNQKIGWTRSEIAHPADGKYQGRRYYRLKEETFMKLRTLGMVQESTVRLEVDFTPDLKPLGFDFALTTPQTVISATGEVQGDELVTRIKTLGGEEEKRYTLGEDMDIFGLADLRRAVNGFKVGEVITGQIFEPNLLGVVPYRLEIKDTALMRTGSQEQTVYVVSMKMETIETISYVTPEGELVRSEGPMGIRMVRESELDAKNLAAGANVADLYLTFAVPVDTMIPQPETIDRAVFEITGAGDYQLDSGGAQTMERVETGVIRVTVDAVAGGERHASATPREYLAPSPHIQSDDKRVVDKAKEIAAGARTPEEKVRRIYEWVYSSVEKAPTFTIPSTVDVLTTLRGDCNEHAALFCGLARAAGIPTRVAAGIVYTNGFGEPGFFYHAWNECWLNGAWVPVDATLHQFPASAMRIRFATGDLTEQIRIAGLAGKIRIKVLEAEDNSRVRTPSAPSQ